MSDDDDESPNTIFLKEPLVRMREEEPSAPAQAIRLVCLDTSLLDSAPPDTGYLLTQGEETIGRGSESTVRIDSSEVSREHARITAYSDRWVIEDVGSRNGTSVNDGRITGRTVISAGDILHLGKIPFRFAPVDDESADQPAANAAQDQDNVDDDGMISFPEAKEEKPMPLQDESEELSLPDPGELSLPVAEELSLPEPPAPSLPEVAETPSSTITAPPAPPPAAPPVAKQPATAPAGNQPEPLLARTRLSAAGPGLSAGVTSADAVSLRTHVPQLIALLLEQAKAGDAQSARACIEFLIHEEQRLPADVAGGGAIGVLVKKIMGAMTQGNMPPRQALDALRAIEAARDLLKKA